MKPVSRTPARTHAGRLGMAALIALVLALAAVPHVARASTQLTVGNPGLSHFDADGGVDLDFGLTDQNGNPVANLSATNVKVFEDGKPATIVNFHGMGQGRPVDIVFVMDVTESMQPYIDAVKNNIIEFVKALAANNRNYRLGLVTFEDYVISKYPDCNCAYRDSFTTNVNTFISWVSPLRASGGGDIPEDQLDALAYAAALPFRPNAQGIVILITDAPCHVKGDGPDREGDAAYLAHTTPGADVTELTGSDVANLMRKDGLTLYAVVPPPFIEPAYQQIVQATHGRLYNIITQENRLPELVRELGHTIATEYSLTYLTPRPIEDGTTRQVKLVVNYNGQSAVANTSYQVRGIGGAVINEPTGGAAGRAGATTGTGLVQVRFNWWNGAVPLIAILLLFGLSRMRFGVSTDELRAIVEAQKAAPRMPSLARPGAPPPAAARTPAAPPRPAAHSGAAAVPLTTAAGGQGARLTAVEPQGPIPAEYSLLKDEISLGRGENNDVVIPHASVSRAHARLLRRDGVYELIDLNSTNGSYVNDAPVKGSARIVKSGSEVRFGDVRFILNF